VFTAAVAAALVRGEKPECNCFGALTSRRAGAGTLVRNGLLGLGAGACAIAGPGESIPHALAGVSAGAVAAVVALLLVLAALTIVSVQLVGQNGRLLARVEALEASLSANASGGAQQGEGPTCARQASRSSSRSRIRTVRAAARSGRSLSAPARRGRRWR
jgi:hypothetical protein